MLPIGRPAANARAPDRRLARRASTTRGRGIQHKSQWLSTRGGECQGVARRHGAYERKRQQSIPKRPTVGCAFCPRFGKNKGGRPFGLVALCFDDDANAPTVGT